MPSSRGYIVKLTIILKKERNTVIPYQPELREKARFLRKNSTKSEIVLWQKIKNRSLGVQFHRQVPMLNYIVDFYCHEIGLAIEIDGSIHDNQFLYDAKRQGEIEKRGVQFIRFKNEDVLNNLTSVIDNLIGKIKELE